MPEYTLGLTGSLWIQCLSGAILNKINTEDFLLWKGSFHTQVRNGEDSCEDEDLQ